MSFITTTTGSQNLGLPAAAWRTVVLLCFAGCLNYLDRTMVTTMRSSIVNSVHITDAQFGLLTSVFLWVYGLLSPFSGFIADRFSRSRVIIVSLFMWSAVTAATAYATTFEQLLATRVLMGITEACYIPAALALIVDYHKGATRSLASGLHVAGILLGQSLGFVGGWMAETYDWSTPFSVFGLAGIGYSFLLLFLLKDAPVKKQTLDEVRPGLNFSDALKSLFSSRPFIVLLLFWSLLGIVGWMVVGWMPTYYQEHFGLGQSEAGLYATAYLYPASIAGVILGGYLTDRWVRHNIYARILIPIIGLSIAVPCIFFASNTTILPLAIVLFMLYAMASTFSDANIMPILCLISDSRYRATGFGILNLFACVIGGIGLYMAGVLRDRQVDLGKMFQFASILMILCIGLLYLIKRKGWIKPEKI
jgi:MFS family permease